MTEREMLRLILVNQAHVISTLAMICTRVSIGAAETETMLNSATKIMDLIEKDEEEYPNG